MPISKRRTTIYLMPEYIEALKTKALCMGSNTTVTDLITAAIKENLLDEYKKFPMLAPLIRDLQEKKLL